MSDPGRKDFSTKAKETLTPDSTKTTAEKVKEATTDTADRVAREGTTGDSKSKTQDAVDHAEHGKDKSAHGSTHETVGDKIKHAVGLDKK